MQIRTDEMYREFPSRSVAADVHGILMRVASLQDTLAGKIVAWQDQPKQAAEGPARHHALSGIAL
jgi:hypothetical protein